MQYRGTSAAALLGRQRALNNTLASMRLESVVREDVFTRTPPQIQSLTIDRAYLQKRRRPRASLSPPPELRRGSRLTW